MQLVMILMKDSDDDPRLALVVVAEVREYSRKYGKQFELSRDDRLSRSRTGDI